MSEVKITLAPEGPYIVEGEIELIGLDDKVVPTKKKVFLCRCGASTRKPFCDGTHSRIGFEAATKAVPESEEN